MRLNSFVPLLVWGLTTSVVESFTPAAFARGLPQTKLFSEKPEGDEEGLDLNLEEMFEM